MRKSTPRLFRMVVYLNNPGLLETIRNFQTTLVTFGNLIVKKKSKILYFSSIGNWCSYCSSWFTDRWQYMYTTHISCRWEPFSLLSCPFWWESTCTRSKSLLEQLRQRCCQLLSQQNSWLQCSDCEWCPSWRWAFKLCILRSCHLHLSWSSCRWKPWYEGESHDLSESRTQICWSPLWNYGSIYISVCPEWPVPVTWL